MRHKLIRTISKFICLSLATTSIAEGFSQSHLQEIEVLDRTLYPTDRVQFDLGTEFSESVIDVSKTFVFRTKKNVDLPHIIFDPGNCKIAGEHISPDRTHSSLLGSTEHGLWRHTRAKLQFHVNIAQPLEGGLDCVGSALIQAENGRQIARVEISGIVIIKPAWIQRPRRIVSEVSFVFMETSRGPRSDMTITSEPIYLRLRGSFFSESKTLFSSPKRCFIGDNRISDNNIQLVVDDKPIADGSAFTFRTLVFSKVELRISDASNNGRSSGPVGCLLDGALTYTY